MTAQPPFNRQHLVIVAVLEGLVIAGAVLRMVLVPGAVDLARTSHLAWFVATIFLAASGVMHFVLRSVALTRRAQPGEDVSDQRKQVLVISIAIIAGAALVAIAGPAMFERILGA